MSNDLENTNEQHKSFFDKAKDALSHLKDKAEETYENLHVDEKLNEAIASAKEAASGLTEKAGEAWETAKDKAGDVFDAAKDKLGDALGNSEEEVK